MLKTRVLSVRLYACPFFENETNIYLAVSQSHVRTSVFNNCKKKTANIC